MPLIHNDPEHWRRRAAEARAVASRMTDPVGKENMLAVAGSYDRIAIRAEERHRELPQVAAARLVDELRMQ